MLRNQRLDGFDSSNFGPRFDYGFNVQILQLRALVCLAVKLKCTNW